MRHSGCCGSHQEACVQEQVTIHPSSPRSLCSPPLSGSCDRGTTSLGEHTAHLRLRQRHVGLFRHRLTLHSVPLPPTDLSEPLNQCAFNPLLSGQRTDTRGRHTCRGMAKSKAEPQELCKERREREISPCSLRSSGLNRHSQLDVPCICGIPE